MMETDSSCGPRSGRALAMESPGLTAVLVPEDGGRLVSLRERESGRELIWTNPRTAGVFRPYSCNYDDLSNSGVEEAFPTVQPCPVEGAELPFFGEVWNLPWRVEEAGRERVEMTCFSPIWPARLTKTYSFAGGGRSLSVRYRIENVGAAPFPYLFGVHPSFTLAGDSRLFAPEGEYALYASAPERAEGVPRFLWPRWGELDFRITRSRESLGCYNAVAMPVQGGSFGVVHPAWGLRVTVAFDPAYFRCLSLWPIYGGFRGHRCLMSEVFTCWPASLDQAVALGLADTLAPGEAVETEVDYRVTREGQDHV